MNYITIPKYKVS